MIAVETPKPPRGMACLVVLGAGRSTYGIGLYPSQAAFNRFLQAGLNENYDELTTSGLTQVTFDTLENLPGSDALVWVEKQLPVAGSKAYPLVMKHLGKGRISRPDKNELSFLEAVLLAMSLATENEIDSGRFTKEVNTFDGPVLVTLSIPDLLHPECVNRFETTTIGI